VASNETSFKKELRETVKAVYGTRVHMWNTTDKFVQGIPDTCVTFTGISMGWEAKFVKQLPKTMGAKVLKHTVSGPQLTWLTNNVLAGGVGVVVVGAADDALFLPTRYIDPSDGNIIKANFSIALGVALRVRKVRGIWQVEGLLEKLALMKGQL
jgi:hypothetical protein